MSDERPAWLTEVMPDVEDPVVRVCREHDDHQDRLDALNEYWETVDRAIEWSETPSADEVPEWATVDEVASLMRMNRKTITSAINAGDIPAKKFGQQYRLHVPTIIESFRRQLDNEGQSETKPKPAKKAKKKRKKKRKKNTKRYII